jgi:serine/threonine-protein kinase HipA
MKKPLSAGLETLSAIREVKVALNFGDEDRPVGRLEMSHRDRTIYFEYDSAFIRCGIEISPWKLPLQSGSRSFGDDSFEGLPGVLNDSLPTGWGRLLFDRFVKSQGISRDEITPLDRLARIGRHGLGAFIFEPDLSIDKTQVGINPDSLINLNNLATQVQKVLDRKSTHVLPELIVLNGSMAGTHPKVLIGVNKARDYTVHGTHDLAEGYTPWVVKFLNSQYEADAGAIEYVYALMAKEAGIAMPETHLFPAKKAPGYFGAKRFDRDGNKRYHMHTVCGLLHVHAKEYVLDYEDLIALTGNLTRDVREAEKMYRLAVFNVLAHNRDDHSKHFSYLMDQDGQWKLSPAYDLTFSPGPGEKQSTMVMGEYRNPTTEHLLKLASKTGIKKDRATEIIEVTKSSLSRWPELAKQYGVSNANIRLIGRKINQTNAQKRSWVPFLGK